jgi:hypothetical protein
MLLLASTMLAYSTARLERLFHVVFVGMRDSPSVLPRTTLVLPGRGALTVDLSHTLNQPLESCSLSKALSARMPDPMLSVESRWW